MEIVYFFIGFVIFFFTYKKYWPIIQKKMEDGYAPSWIDFKEFWIMVLVPLFWLFAIPLYFLWLGLEKIYAKFFENKTGNAENR